MTRARFPHVLAVLSVVLAASAAHAGGLDIHTDVDAQELGLPAYPGAVRSQDGDGGANGFSFGLWGAAFGVKLVVASYDSSDGVDAVAAFYRDALRHYGPVLDCSANRGKPAASPDQSDGDLKKNVHRPVTCDNDTVEPGGRLFKVGTGAAQHVFKATPRKGGTHIELVRLEGHADD